MEERYNDIFAGGDEEDLKAKEDFRRVPLEKLKDHLKLVEKAVQSADFNIGLWYKFKYRLMKEPFFRWDGKGKEFWERFRICVDDLKTVEECVVVHFDIENIWPHFDELPSIWSLIYEWV